MEYSKSTTILVQTITFYSDINCFHNEQMCLLTIVQYIATISLNYIILTQSYSH